MARTYEIDVSNLFEDYELRDGSTYFGLISFRVVSVAMWDKHDDEPHFLPKWTWIYVGSNFEREIALVNDEPRSCLSDVIAKTIQDDKSVWAEMSKIAVQQAIRDGFLKLEAA